MIIFDFELISFLNFIISNNYGKHIFGGKLGQIIKSKVLTI